MSNLILKSIEDVRTVFEVGPNKFGAYTVVIDRRSEPVKYVSRTGTAPTRSRRYWGYILNKRGERLTWVDGNGNTQDYFSNYRGGAVSRKFFNLYTREEHNQMLLKRAERRALRGDDTTQE